ncbi:hypothetical protein ABD440_20395 [Chromobacterium piscinae]|uniref:S10 family serine carboxypeptidase-like protein n=1 Tax=Chromobacterium piscinae TaxID=686831 RepID=UPI0031FCDF5D
MDEKNRAQSMLDEFIRAYASPFALQRQSAGRIAIEINRFMQHCCGRDLRDIRHPPQTPSKTLGEYLKKPSVQQALRIDRRSNNELQPQSGLVAEAVWLENSSHLLLPLLDQLKVLFFHGECCMAGNYLGLDAWLNTQTGPQADALRQQKRQAWRPYGLAAGLIRSHGNLSQIIVQNAGLRVARDQPAAAQAMLRDFLSGGDSKNDTGIDR